MEMARGAIVAGGATCEPALQENRLPIQRQRDATVRLYIV